LNIVISNCVGILDNGQEVIPYPSRWDSGLPNGQKKPFAFYPYELALLSTLLKRELGQHSVKMLDPNIESWDGDRTIEEIAKYQPDVLIMELSALTYPTMTRVLAGVRGSIHKDVESILCGPMAAVDHKEAEHIRRWNVAIRGEYELEALHHLGGTVPPRARTDAGLINLDWLPWPEDEDVDRSRYYEVNHYAEPAVIQVYPTRGCPLSCTFCVVPTYYGGHGKTSRSHRTRDVGDVCDEIEYLAELYPSFRGCYFNEEAHSANPEWLRSFCTELIRRGLNKYSYDAMCGMWSFDEALVKLCAEAGYKQIRFGMESTSATVGKAIHKTIHKDKTEIFLGWLKKYGIKAYATVQIGAMGSTETIDRQTLEDVRRWYAMGLLQKHQVSTSTPQPGTPFYDQAKEEGWLVTENINLYDGINAVVSYPEYTADRIQAVRMAA